MRRCVLALACLLLGVACGDVASLPDVDLDLHVAVEEDDVELGRAFPLEVVRVWRRDLVPADWDDRSLAPLDVRLEDVSRTEDGRHVQETRRYRAYAFTLGDLVVPAPTTTARTEDGEQEFSAASRRLRLRVRSALGATASKAPELPGPPLPEPFPWPPWAFAAAALGAALAWRFARSRPAALPADANLVAAPPPTPPYLRALERLGAIRRRADDDAERDVADTCDVVRDYVGEHVRVAASEMTTQELGSAPEVERGFPASDREVLLQVLRRGDRVKFAAIEPSTADLDALLDLAETFVGGGAR